MRLLVYTCVFGRYDWVFPPIKHEKNIDHVIVTDDPEMRISGWKTVVVNSIHFHTPKIANLYYRALIHKLLPGYDYSLYLDGNIRLLGITSDFFLEFISSGATLGLFRHPIRQSVHEEAATCLKLGKCNDPNMLTEELEYYKQQGFVDAAGLVETGIILKNYHKADLDECMQLWWQLFSKFGTRDQISLPYVLWKTDVKCMYHPYSFRDPNPYFGIYTHRGDKRAPKGYAYIEGRAYDSFFYRALLRVWQFSWVIRRKFRSLLHEKVMPE